MSGDLVRLGGVWKNKTKTGVQYLSGQLGGYARLVILPNRDKTKEADPDYIVYAKNANYDKDATNKDGFEL